MKLIDVLNILFEKKLIFLIQIYIYFFLKKGEL